MDRLIGGKKLKQRLLLVLVLVSLFLSFLPVVSRTWTKNEADTSPLSQNPATSPEATTDSQTAEGQSLSTPLASNNDTTANAASPSPKEPKTYDYMNASLSQLLSITPPQLDNLPSKRIHPPGLFPVFYDGGTGSADGCP